MDITADHIFFYECLTAAYYSEPYATISIQEATSIINRFAAWRTMIESHPDLTEYKKDTLPLINDLPEAVRGAKQSGLFPKVLLSKEKYTATLALWEQSCKAASTVQGLLKDSSVMADW